MKLECIEWEVEGVTVLNVAGALTLGEATATFRRLIAETLAAGKRSILLNLSDVYYMDSSGLGELVRALATVKASSGQLKLLKISPKTRDLIHLTKLYMIFEIYEEESQAISSFAKA